MFSPTAMVTCLIVNISCYRKINKVIDGTRRREPRGDLTELTFSSCSRGQRTKPVIGRAERKRRGQGGSAAAVNVNKPHSGRLLLRLRQIHTYIVFARSRNMACFFRRRIAAKVWKPKALEGDTVC